MCKSVASLLLIVAVLCAGCGGNGSSSSARPGQPARRAEDVLAAQLQQGLNQNKQQVFDRIHPIGTAISATVHDVTITWKHGQPTNRMEDVQAFTVRYTLYWQGPITKDGFTKISDTFDTETQRCTSSQLLATNGVTRQDVDYTVGFIGGALLRQALENNNNEQ